MTQSGRVLRVGNQVRFEDDGWTVAGLDGARVRLVDDAGRTQVVLAGHLLASAGFTVLNTDRVTQRLDPIGLMDALPDHVAQQA
jgi:putative transposase